MRFSLKKIIFASVTVIAVAAFVRTCRSSSPQNLAHRTTTDRHTSTVKSESTSFWNFFDDFFGSAEKKASLENEEAVEESNEGPHRSELNILSEQIEKEEKLPESIWYPNSTDKEEIERHTALLREMLMLGRIVKSGTATSEQRDRYYDIKLKIIQEKLELIKDYRKRYKDLADPDDNDEIVVQLQQEINTIKTEMKRR